MAELPQVLGGSRPDSGSQGWPDRHAIMIACQFSPVAHLLTKKEEIFLSNAHIFHEKLFFIYRYDKEFKKNMDICKKYLNSDIYLNKSMSAYKKFLKLLCLLISVWESSLIFPNTWKYKKQHKYNQNLITSLTKI